MDTEVIEGEREGLLDGSLTHRLLIDHGHIEGVVDGFGDTPEHQHRTHTTGEQHGEPHHQPVLGFIIIIAEFHTPVAGGEDADEEDEDEGHTTDIHPPEVLQQPSGHRTETITGGISQDHGGNHEGHDDPHGQQEDEGVGLQTQKMFLFRVLRDRYFLAHVTVFV